MLIRTISSIVAVALLVVMLVLKDTIFFNALLALICSIAVFELLKAFDLIKIKTITVSCIAYSFISVFITFFSSVGYIFAESDNYSLFYILATVNYSLVFMLAFVLLASMLFSKYTVKFEQIAISFCAASFISFSFKSLIQIKELVDSYNPNATIYILILTACGAWIADTSAYLVGTAIGKHKLCPSISPKKSIEGFVGGVFFNGAVFLLLGLLFSHIDASLKPNYLLLFLLGVLCALVGCIGDLFASYIKRCTGIKDFGKIMPGHGGVLDRFDSFLLVSPAVYILLQIFYKFAPIL